MRVLLAALGTVLILSGCATARYAEVWHKKPQLTGPPGSGSLAVAEQSLTRAMHEERAKPLAALGDCLDALQSASNELERDPRNPTAVRDYNFGVSRIFQIVHDAKLDPWTQPLTVATAHGDFVLTHEPDPRPEWNPALYEFTPADEFEWVANMLQNGPRAMESALRSLPLSGRPVKIGVSSSRPRESFAPLRQLRAFRDADA